jgi:flavin reductase (DIM6/NTAB) family NADH-FMN oxidoreductase RutF
MRDFDPSELEMQDQYKLMSGSVIPRPIGLITTIGSEGVNAAPFSFFNCIGVEPPMLILSISPRAGVIKDTIENLRETPEFVAHIVGSHQRDEMNICAIDFPRGTSEIDQAGWTTTPSLKVAPPRITECKAQFECTVMEMKPMGRIPYMLVIGEVVMIHMDDSIVNDRLHIDAAELDALGRLAGNGGYCRITDRFFMPFIGAEGFKPREGMEAEKVEPED